MPPRRPPRRRGGRRPFPPRPVPDAEGWEAGEEWDERDAFSPPDGGEERWWEEEVPARPIRVAGGIVAESRRGEIGTTWWSRRFLAALEAVLVGGRLSRGRSYARQGQVLDLSLRPGTVAARVQGSRPEPYAVTLSLPVVPGADWDRIVAALAAEAGYAARLLAGELPHEAEAVFAAEGASLFPSPQARLTTACTCPDWANPCKHVAAVCYLLAEAFDRDPFEILRWRGRDRTALLAELRRLRGAHAPAPPAASGPPPTPRRPVPALEALVGDYWRAPALGAVKVRPEAADQPDAVLRQLPAGELAVGTRDVAALLAPAYRALSAAAAGRALAED